MLLINVVNSKFELEICFKTQVCEIFSTMGKLSKEQEQEIETVFAFFDKNKDGQGPNI